MPPKKKTAHGIEPSSHPLVDHPEYVEAIGMVALEAIALELRLALLLARMLFLPIRVGQAIYLSPKAEHARLDILKNAAHARLSVSSSHQNTKLGRKKSKALSEVMKIHKKASNLLNQRHRVMHDEWNYSDKEKQVTRKLIDGIPGRRGAPVERDEVETLVREMRFLIDEIYDLSESFRVSPPFMANMRND